MIKKFAAILAAAFGLVAISSSGVAHADVVIGPVNQPAMNLPAGCLGAAGVFICTGDATPGAGNQLIYTLHPRNESWDGQLNRPKSWVPTGTPAVGGTSPIPITILPPVTTPAITTPIEICVFVQPCIPAGSSIVGSQTVTPPPVTVPGTPVVLPAQTIFPLNTPLVFEANPYNGDVTFWSPVDPSFVCPIIHDALYPNADVTAC